MMAAPVPKRFCRLSDGGGGEGDGGGGKGEGDGGEGDGGGGEGDGGGGEGGGLGESDGAKNWPTAASVAVELVLPSRSMIPC